jgi:hypothetical protein
MPFNDLDDPYQMTALIRTSWSYCVCPVSGERCFFESKEMTGRTWPLPVKSP